MFNSENAKIAGQLSKRGKALPLEIKQNLQLLAQDILTTIELSKLNTGQKLKLLEIILRHTMPKDLNITQESLPNQVTFEIIKSKI